LRLNRKHHNISFASSGGIIGTHFNPEFIRDFLQALHTRAASTQIIDTKTLRKQPADNSLGHIACANKCNFGL
jgi:hypothetical protein